MRKNLPSALRSILPLLLGLLVSAVGNHGGKWLAGRGIGTFEVNFAVIVLGLFVLLFFIFQAEWRWKIKKARIEQDLKIQPLITRQLNLFKDEELPDKFKVNSALDRVLQSQGEDLEAISTVLKYCSKLPPCSLYDWSESIERQRPGGGIWGLTAEMGEVEIKDKGSEPEYITSLNKTRVGQYKIWRDLKLLFIQPYFKADLNTVTDILDSLNGYAIRFDPETFEPKGFGILEQQEINFGLPFESKKVLLLIHMLTGEQKGKKLTISIFKLLTK